MEAWLQAHRAELLEDLRRCIRIPSVYQEDDSGYPFGLPVHRCLTFMLDLARQKGLAVHNMDNYLGWCEYGQGEELVAVLAHLDVVPPGPVWDQEQRYVSFTRPFSPLITGYSPSGVKPSWGSSPPWSR